MTRFQFRGLVQFSQQGVAISPDLVGGTFEVGSDLPSEPQVHLRFPQRDELFNGEPAYGGWSGDQDTPTTLDLLCCAIGVDFDVDVAPEAALSPTPDTLEPLRAAIDAACGRARSKASLMGRWVRLEQPWLGQSDDLVHVVPLGTYIGESDAKVPIGTTITLRGTYFAFGSPFVAGSEMGTLVDHLRRDVEPPTTSSLLADALFLGRWRQPRDLASATLLAAMACEVRAKEVLVDAAPTQSRPLLEMMLENTRTFPKPAQELFHSIPKALIDRSLKDDQPEAFARIGTLFQKRNKLVHTGEQPDPLKVGEWLSGAEVAFRWLGGLP